MDSDDITVLDAEVVADDPVEADAALVKLLIGKDDQNSVLPLLAADQDCVATEQTESIHCLLGEGDDGVVIVGSIGDPARSVVSLGVLSFRYRETRFLACTYMSWLGFFFFFKMAVAVSSSCRSASASTFKFARRGAWHQPLCARHLKYHFLGLVSFSALSFLQFSKANRQDQGGGGAGSHTSS